MKASDLFWSFHLSDWINFWEELTGFVKLASLSYFPHCVHSYTFNHLEAESNIPCQLSIKINWNLIQFWCSSGLRWNLSYLVLMMFGNNRRRINRNVKFLTWKAWVCAVTSSSFESIGALSTWSFFYF